MTIFFVFPKDKHYKCHYNDLKKASKYHLEVRQVNTI